MRGASDSTELHLTAAELPRRLPRRVAKRRQGWRRAVCTLRSRRPACGKRSDFTRHTKNPGEEDSPRAQCVDRAPHPNPLPVRTGRGRRDTTPHSRSAIAPELCADHPQKKQRAQGMPGARCTHSLACKMKTSIRVSHHRFAETLRHSLRDGVNGFLRALPGDRALLPPLSAE